jgi:ribonuclease HI
MPTFTCETCQASFDVPPETLTKYPGWQPRFCMQHRKGAKSQSTFGKRPATPQRSPWQIASGQGQADSGPRQPSPRSTDLDASQLPIQRLPPGAARGSKTFKGGDTGFNDQLSLTPEEVLRRYTAGPTDGVFTDGGSRPNPGVGGWGFVWVRDNQVVQQKFGGERLTTNNRMEMTAIIEALMALPKTEEVTIYSDSNLAVQTLNEWAKRWKSKGWTKTGGEIKNLDLVMEAYDLLGQHPHVKVQWIKAHDGSRWNEYADALATQGMQGDK